MALRGARLDGDVQGLLLPDQLDVLALLALLALVLLVHAGAHLPCSQCSYTVLIRQTCS